jgi:hypothetical protein
VDKDTLLTELRLQRDIHQKALESLQYETREVINATVQRVPQLKKDALMWESTRRLGEIMEEASLQWFDETIVMIEKEF